MLITEVINLPRMLPEIGKIKIGNKGAKRTADNGSEYRLPQKLDHFIITTSEKDKNDDFVIDSEIHAIFGDQPKELPIRLLFNELKLNFISRYAIYKGKDKCICEGDGASFYWLDEKTGKWDLGRIPTEEMNPDFKGDKCKINGVLSCVIDGVNKIGGVWKFRTVGINSVISIKSGLEFIQQLTGGQLAGIPLMLVLRPKNVSVKGKSTKVYVVNIEYRGTIEQLQDTAYKILTSRSIYSHKLLQVEQQAIKLLETTPNPFDEDIADTVTEFYPAQQDGFEEKDTDTDDISKLDDPVIENAEVNDIPDLDIDNAVDTTKLQAEQAKQEILSKISKMRTDAISKVNEAKTIDDLNKLKAGIGYKDDFGEFKKEADAVIIDVLEIINKKILELTPAPEAKPVNVSDKLKEYGLDHAELRNQFYKTYGASEQYLNDLPLLEKNVNEYKLRKIKGLISSDPKVTTSIPYLFKELNGKSDPEHLEKCMAEWSDIDTTIDVKNFKPLWDLYLKIKNGEGK